MTNAELEAAAVAAETWKERSAVACADFWLDPATGTPSPAVASLPPYRQDFASRHKRYDFLRGIYPNYEKAIDAGKGDEVAAAFRKAKKIGVLFVE